MEFLGWRLLGGPKEVGAGPSSSSCHSERVVSLPSHLGRGVQNPHPNPRLPDPRDHLSQPKEQRTAWAEDKALWGSESLEHAGLLPGLGRWLPLPAMWVSGAQGLLWSLGAVRV